MRKITSFGLLITVLGIFTFTSIYLFNNIESSTEKKGWEVHSKNVIEQINVLLKYNYRHQSVLRGFIITKDSAAYNRFLKNGDEFKKSLYNLDSLVSQDKNQSLLVDSLAHLYKLNNRILKETLRSAKDPLNLDSTIYFINEGNKISRGIALLADEMIQEENKLLVERDKAFTENVNESKRTLIFLFSFFILFMIIIIGFVYINYSAIKKAKAKLEKNNALLSQSKKQVEAINKNLQTITGRFETSLNYSNVASFDWVDINKSELWVSDNLFEMLCIPKESFTSTIANFFSELMHPQDKKRAAAELKKSLDTKTVCNIEYKLRTKNGDFKNFRMVGTTFENNGVQRMTGVIINIDREVAERKTREDIIRNWEEFSVRFDLAMESSEYGVWDWFDISEEYQWWSKTLYELLGYNITEIKSTSSNLFDLVHPDDLAIFKKGIQQNLESGIQLNVEYRLRTKKNGYKWFRVVGNKFCDTTSMKDRMVGVVSDISAEKNFLQELERSNDELENFAYIASHDLQEPLRKIQAFGDRLKFVFEQEKTELPGKELLEKMTNSATRMRVLIEDLLSYSRISRELSYADDVNLTELIFSVEDFISETIREKNASIVIEGELPVIRECNKTNLFQLFQNLLSNAIKFQKSGVKPEVIISSKIISGNQAFEISPSLNRYDAYFYISVKDNGIGFDEKYLDRIFTIFQRLHGRHEFQGTGIGLALCKKICENHYGFITAKSIMNEGAEFIVILPKVSKEK